MKANVGKFMLCLLLAVLLGMTCAALAEEALTQTDAAQTDTAQTQEIQSDEAEPTQEPQPVRQDVAQQGAEDGTEILFHEDVTQPPAADARSAPEGADAEESAQANAIEGRKSGKDVETQLTARQMVTNLKLSGIGGDKTEAICLIAEMLLADGKEVEFVAGVCGNVICEGRCGMFERDWGGSVQKYLPSRMSGDPYKYGKKYANRHIYEGFSLSEVYKMAKDMYYSYNWDTGKYKFGIGCVQWTHKRTMLIVEYYIAEANGSDTITYEQCVAAEMKFIDYELNNTETGAYEHWSAGDHRSKYKNEAARAGYCVARYYERCHSDYYATRAESARRVYEAMTGKYEVSLPQMEDSAEVQNDA